MNNPLIVRSIYQTIFSMVPVPMTCIISKDSKPENYFKRVLNHLET